MRILHTIDSNGLYGAEMVLLNLAGEQHRRGHVPIILSLGNRNCGEKALETQARIRGLQCIKHRMRDGLNLYGAARLLEIAEQQSIDVIHSHGYKSNILLTVMPKSARKRPAVATIHGWTAKRSWSKLGLYRFVDQRLLHRFDAVVVVNEELTRSPAISSLENSRVHAIANGIVVGPAATPASADSFDDPLTRNILALRKTTGLVIGAVGRLSPEKNFSALIEALHTATNSQPLGAAILGDGPEAASLKQLIASRGLSERVLLGGYVEDARRYLGLFDLLVIPSLTEGLPMILLEAMSANLPVIATAVGSIPAVLGDLGILVEPGNIAEMSSAILAMAGEPEHYKNKASAGSTRVLECYSSTTMADRYDDVYRSVLQ